MVQPKPAISALQINGSVISGLITGTEAASVTLYIQHMPVAQLALHQASIEEADAAGRFDILLSRRLMRFIHKKDALALSVVQQLLAIEADSLKLWREVNRLPLTHLAMLLQKGWVFDAKLQLRSPYQNALKHGFEATLVQFKRAFCTVFVAAPATDFSESAEVALFVDELPLGGALLSRDSKGRVGFTVNLNKKLLSEIIKRHSLQFEIAQQKFELPLSVFQVLDDEIKAIVITQPQVLSRLHSGCVLNDKGQLVQPKDQDPQWLADTLSLYQRACRFFSDKLGYTLYLTGGTLLGFARQGGAISFDKDFDSGYLSAFDDPAAIRQEFKQIIIDLLVSGEDIRLLTPVGDKIRCDYFMWYDKSGTHIDVFPGAFINGCYRRPTFVDTKLTKTDFYPFKQALFSGYQVNVPNNVEKKVSAVYGDTWRYPDPFWVKVRSAAIVKYRRQIMLSAEDCLHIAAVSVREGDSIRQLIADGKFVSQL